MYVSACAEDDQDQIDEAATWVSPEALSFGVNELACRAVIALARERDESPADGGADAARPARRLTPPSARHGAREVRRGRSFRPCPAG